MKRQRKSLRSNEGTEARKSFLLTAVAGGFAVTLVRNETQQHSVALKSAGQSPIGLLPLNRIKQSFLYYGHYHFHLVLHRPTLVLWLQYRFELTSKKSKRD